MTMTTVQIAKVAHEVNRAFCEAIGDTSQLSWDKAPEWQRRSALEGVLFHLTNPDARPEAAHENWSKLKVKEGWVHGEVKSEDAKTHPCLLPFSELPVAQQAKDYLFRTIVHQLS